MSVLSYTMPRSYCILLLICLYNIIGIEVSDSVALDHTHSTDDQLELQDTRSADLQGN